MADLYIQKGYSIRQHAQREQHPFPQESCSGRQKDKAHGWFSQIVVSALSSVQCFDSCQMDDRKGMQPVKPVPLIPNGSWKSEEETEGGGELVKFT